MPEETNNPKFTPGPWEVSTTITSTGDWPCVRGALGEDGGWVVALIDQLCTSRSTFEPEANAQLIAAAPVLYERLKDVLTRCKELDVTMCDNFEHDGDCDCEGDKGRAALALVDGPQTKEVNK